MRASSFSSSCVLCLVSCSFSFAMRSARCRQRSLVFPLDGVPPNGGEGAGRNVCSKRRNPASDSRVPVEPARQELPATRPRLELESRKVAAFD